MLEEEEVRELALDRVPAGPEEDGDRNEGQEQRGAALRALHDDGGEDGRGRERERGAEGGRMPEDDGVMGEDCAGGRQQGERDDGEARALRRGHFVLRSVTVAARFASDRKMRALSWSSSRSLNP